MMFDIFGKNGYIDLLRLWSMRPVLAYVRTGRGPGKTTLCSTWSIRHAKRNKGEYMIYIRMSRAQVSESKKSWFKRKNCKLAGISEDDTKIEGNFGYIRIRGEWRKCVRFVQLSTGKNYRSSDDDRAYCMVFDEGDAKPEVLARYRGDFADDLADLHDSMRRETDLPLLIFSNKESASNRILNYHGIPDPPEFWNGIRRYNGKTFVFVSTDRGGPETSENVQRFKKCYGKTRYGEYRFNGRAHSGTEAPTRAKPSNATKYTQIAFSGLPAVSLWRSGDYFYITQGIDRTASKYTFVDKPTHALKGAMVFRSVDLKNRFGLLSRCYRRSMVFCENEATAEIWEQIAKRLGL